MGATAVIGQSGGPTVVINQSLVGCILGLRKVKDVEKILGAKHGVRGIVDNLWIDLTKIPEDTLERIANTPSAALGSSRDKPDHDYCKKILASFEKNNVRYFFYIGGNDSSDTCRIVNDLAKTAGYPLQAFHIPKTIDNDLVDNDHTPGFASAARFVAQAFLGDDLDNRSLPGVKINVVMGRHAGFLTAASVLGQHTKNSGPHLVYIPENIFDIDQFVEDVDHVYKQHGRCLIAVSEGVHAVDGTPIATLLAKKVEKDAHGNVQLSGTGALGDFLAAELKAKLGAKLRVRADTFGYMQRSFPGISSAVDAREAREVGLAAARYASEGRQEGTVLIKRLSDEPYKVNYEWATLTTVAGKTRVMEKDFIASSKQISERFRDYLRPLVGNLSEVELIG